MYVWETYDLLIAVSDFEISLKNLNVASQTLAAAVMEADKNFHLPAEQ